jgi:Allantoicase repeat
VAEVSHVRLDVYPDGGMARVRLWGVLSGAGRNQLARRWFTGLPAGQLDEVLRAAGHPDAEGASRWQAAGAVGPWPAGLRAALLGPGAERAPGPDLR